MKENGKVISEMEKEDYSFKMDQSLMDISKMTRYIGVSSEISITIYLRTIKAMVVL
jgi:hypothetical protein